ncbi:hypothetical protein [Mycoplasmopsis fermentans]|uniref:hypothetical protein n=1 Tax=Mycoplasmopsis fermentans TaxID=2115 RepID=UPI000F041980|nr:hypothetical protein [Mycoplasmopsis fermentans]RMX36063.1 hypothetical protein MFI2_0208 [Mycoplasmopsis fermentans MF-I2]
MIKNKRKKVIATVATALSLTTLGVVSATAFYNVNSWTKLTLKYRNKNEDVFIDSIKVKSGSTWGQVLPLLKDNKFVNEICQNENWRIDEYGAKINNKVINYSDKLAGNKTIMLNFMPRESRQVNFDLHFYFRKGIIDWENKSTESKINFSTIKNEIETRFKAKLRNFGEKMSRIELVKDQHNSKYDVVILKINNIYISSKDKSIVEKIKNDIWEINLKQLFISKGFIKEETFKMEINTNDNKKTNIDYPFYCSELLKDSDFNNSAVFGNESNKAELKNTNNTFKIRYDISPRIKIFDISIDKTNKEHASEVDSLLKNDKLDDIFNKKIFSNKIKNELLPPEKFSNITGNLSCDDFIRSYLEKKYNKKLISSNPNTPLINLYFVSENEKTLYKVPEKVDPKDPVYNLFKNYWESSKEGEIHLYTNTNLYNFDIKVKSDPTSNKEDTFKVKRTIIDNKWSLNKEDLKSLAQKLNVTNNANKKEWFEQNVRNYVTFYNQDDLEKYIISNNVNLMFVEPSQNDTAFEQIDVTFVGRENENSNYQIGENKKQTNLLKITSNKNKNKDVQITFKDINTWEKKGGRSYVLSELNKKFKKGNDIYTDIVNEIKNQYDISNPEKYYTENLDDVNYKIVDYVIDAPSRIIRLSFAKFIKIDFRPEGTSIITNSREREVFKNNSYGLKINYFDELNNFVQTIGRNQNYYDKFISDISNYGLFFVDSKKMLMVNEEI